MIFPRWDAEFWQQLGGGIPLDYCCIDVETSGRSVQKDLVVEFGHCLVENGGVVDEGSHLIDWSGYQDKSFSNEQLRGKLQGVGYHFKKKGKVWRFTWDALCREGKDPAYVLGFYKDFIWKLRERHMTFVTHNGYGFDFPLISNNMERVLGVTDFGWEPGIHVDTGQLEKAHQMEHNPVYWPKTDESVTSYFTRLKGMIPAGVKWSLDEHCVPKYGLIEKHGIDIRDAHQAKFDCYLCHYLIEEWRERWTQPEAASQRRRPPKVAAVDVPKQETQMEPDFAAVPEEPTPVPRRTRSHRRRGQRNR